MSKISIESKPIAFGFDHLYLVFENDAGSEFVIRGGPENSDLLDAPDLLDPLDPLDPVDFGNIITEINVPINESEDARGSDTMVARGNRELDLGGRRPEDVWTIMIQQATSIQNALIDYEPIVSAQNSNSTIASVLNSVGIAVESNIPLNTEASDLPGINNLLQIDTTLVGTAANDIISGYVGDDILLGGDGDDVIDGREGNDVLRGNSGNDILRAGFGLDDLTGGEGRDIFGFYAPGHYQIKDFNPGEDRIFFDSVKTGLNNINELNQMITDIAQTGNSVKVEFGPAASIDLIGVNFADLTVDMIGFAV